MSLLSKYYYRKYMVRTLTRRMNDEEEFPNLQNVPSNYSLLSTMDETYESATSGFFASSGEKIEEEKNNWFLNFNNKKPAL